MTFSILSVLIGFHTFPVNSINPMFFVINTVCFLWGRDCIFRCVPKIANSTIKFVISLHPHGTSRLPLDGLSWNSMFVEFFGQELSVLYMQTAIHFLSYLAHFFLEWKMFHKKVGWKIKTHILFSVTFYRKS